MAKPATRDGYSELHTTICERVLVTLLRGLGPWQESVCLIGGLAPRYLVRARPPEVPEHAGTLDVDLVIDLQMLTRIEAYRSLAQNLKTMGFERARNDKGQPVSWRWQLTAGEVAIVLEFLAEDPRLEGGKVQPLPGEGSISALNIPHSAMVFDMHEEVRIEAELLNDDGMAVVTVKHADLVGFSCLKLFAFQQRFERKDAHDLIYCIEHAPQGLDAVADAFRRERQGRHGAVIASALELLGQHFASSQAKDDGWRKDGPVAVAKFELGQDDEAREARALRQRRVSDLADRLLATIERR